MAAGMRQFQTRLFLRQDFIAAGVDPKRVLTGAEYEAVTIIRDAFPQGCTILDIGCGPGYFVNVMRAANYEVLGLDVARPVVEMLRTEGFPVWHGTIDSVPPGWVNPQVCTAFFMLHHLSDPIAFLTDVRKRFPWSLLVVAVSDSLERGRLRPGFAKGALPRSFTWWGSKQIQLALEKAGYRASVRSVPAQPRGHMTSPAIHVYAAIRGHAPVLARWLVVSYYHTLPILGWPGALWMRWRRRCNYILAVGYPADGP